MLGHALCGQLRWLDLTILAPGALLSALVFVIAYGLTRDAHGGETASYAISTIHALVASVYGFSRAGSDVLNRLTSSDLPVSDHELLVLFGAFSATYFIIDLIITRRARYISER